MKSQTVSKVVFFCFRYLKCLAINTPDRRCLAVLINKLLTIFPTTYLRISPQTVGKMSSIFYVPIVPENWPSAQASGYVYSPSENRSGGPGIFDYRVAKGFK